MQNFTTKTFHINDTIFKEGSSGHAAYIIKSGCVEISIKEDDKRTNIAFLKPPSVFGEMALLLKDHIRIATATAREYTEIIEVTQENFKKFVESSPALIKAILLTLAERLRLAVVKGVSVPDIFVSTCAAINLLFAHGTTDIQYDLVLSAIANILRLDPKIIREQISRLEDLNLLEIKTDSKGFKTFSASSDNFLPRAMKLHGILFNISNVSNNEQ